MAEPYKIFSKVGNSYKVKLPNSVKVYSIFSPNKLQKAATDPLLRQVNPPPLPV